MSGGLGCIVVIGLSALGVYSVWHGDWQGAEVGFGGLGILILYAWIRGAIEDRSTRKWLATLPPDQQFEIDWVASNAARRAVGMAPLSREEFKKIHDNSKKSPSDRSEGRR